MRRAAILLILATLAGEVGAVDPMPSGLALISSHATNWDGSYYSTGNLSVPADATVITFEIEATGTPNNMIASSSPTGYQSRSIFTTHDVYRIVFDNGSTFGGGWTSNFLMRADGGTTTSALVKFWKPGPAFTAPTFTSPAAGATLAGETDTVTWDVGASPYGEYRLLVGTGLDPDKYFTGQPRVNTLTHDDPINLPTDGSPVLLTLQYRAFNGDPWEPGITRGVTAQTAEPPQITSPTAGQEVTGDAFVVQWSAGNVAQNFRVFITGPGGFSQESGQLDRLTTSYTISGLPQDGGQYQVTLRYDDETGSDEPAGSVSFVSVLADPDPDPDPDPGSSGCLTNMYTGEEFAAGDWVVWHDDGIEQGYILADDTTPGAFQAAQDGCGQVSGCWIDPYDGSQVNNFDSQTGAPITDSGEAAVWDADCDWSNGQTSDEECNNCNCDLLCQCIRDMQDALIVELQAIRAALEGTGEEPTAGSDLNSLLAMPSESEGSPNGFASELFDSGLVVGERDLMFPIPLGESTFYLHTKPQPGTQFYDVLETARGTFRLLFLLLMGLNLSSSYLTLIRQY